MTTEDDRNSSQGELADVSPELMLHLRNLFTDEDVDIHATARANVPPYPVVRRHSPFAEVGHRGVSFRDDVHTLTNPKGLDELPGPMRFPDTG